MDFLYLIQIEKNISGNFQKFLKNKYKKNPLGKFCQKLTLNNEQKKVIGKNHLTSEKLN